jgi:hypothetical protein
MNERDDKKQPPLGPVLWNKPSEKFIATMDSLFQSVKERFPHLSDEEIREELEKNGA